MNCAKPGCFGEVDLSQTVMAKAVNADDGIVVPIETSPCAVCNVLHVKSNGNLLLDGNWYIDGKQPVHRTAIRG